MNENKKDTEKFSMMMKEHDEKQLEELFQETPLNMTRINNLITQLALIIYDIEECRAGRGVLEIQNELREKYHLPLIPISPYLSKAEKQRIETLERRLKDLYQKEPLDLSRILNLINTIGHYKALNESQFQEIKQELCEKYNIPYIKHEHTLPFRQYYTHPRQETYYKYTDNTVLRVVGIPTLFEILADLLGL